MTRLVPESEQKCSLRSGVVVPTQCGPIADALVDDSRGSFRGGKADIGFARPCAFRVGRTVRARRGFERTSARRVLAGGPSASEKPSAGPTLFTR
jgi:hypothetical protein